VQTPHYRCSACGNLTRFDVVTTSTVKSFHHFSVGGDVDVEETEVLSSSVDSVVCRWCGHGRSIEIISAQEHAESDEPPAERVE
jgi:DNA-directed RNA polymerase subunit RPC12/RpoP